MEESTQKLISNMDQRWATVIEGYEKGDDRSIQELIRMTGDRTTPEQFLSWLKRNPKALLVIKQLASTAVGEVLVRVYERKNCEDVA